MIPALALAILAHPVLGMWGQTPASRPRFDSFEVATVKPVDSTPQSGRYLKMLSRNRFIGRDYTLKLLIAAAFDLSPKTISGGPSWITSEHYNIEALTAGDVQPSHDEQMSMLRSLLIERFQLTFHREQKDFPIYTLEVARGGPKLQQSSTPADDPHVMGPGVVYPQRVVLPARNATIGDLASLLQRAILDRPVVDHTDLSGRYDFDLVWAPDESQFDGDVSAASATTPAAPLFQALQDQLGLKITATHGSASALVIDSAQRPSSD